MRYQPEEAADTPRWGLPRAVIVMLGMAGAVIVVADVKSFSSVIGPAVFALMLTRRNPSAAKLAAAQGVFPRGWPLSSGLWRSTESC